jgi:hypothetical protein
MGIYVNVHVRRWSQMGAHKLLVAREVELDVR